MRYFGLLLCLMIVVALACATIPFRAMSSLVGDGLPTTGTGSESCANVNQPHPDNPFAGWPVDGSDWGRVTAFYCDPYYYHQFGSIHHGIDLAYSLGTAVKATAAATVRRAEILHPYRGNNVEICAAGWCAVHMHLDTMTVFVGQTVTHRATLGTIGDSGNSTGAHLHYELHDPAGNPVDPRPTMP